MPAFSDYLLRSTAVLPGLFVQLVNNATAVAYVSDGPADANGKFSFTNSIPTPGTYTMSTSPTGAPPWAPTGDNLYVVAGDQVVLKDWGGAEFNAQSPLATGGVAPIDGSTDASTAINSDLVAISAAGGGRLRLQPGKTYAFANSIVLQNDASLEFLGATLKWTGAAGGTLFTSPTGDPLLRAKLLGGKVDPGSGHTGIVFGFHSPQYCEFDVEVISGSATNTVWRWQPDATNVSGYDGSRNAVFNRIHRLKVSGPCGVLMDWDGTAAVGLSTLNTVHILLASDVRGKAIRFIEWCDNNVIDFCRVSLTANNATAVIYNDSGTPNADVGVYANHFGYLAVDAFGAPTGRKAVVLNWTKENTIRRAFNGSAANLGAFVTDNNSQSHWIEVYEDLTGAPPTIYSKGYTLVTGAGRLAHGVNLITLASPGAVTFDASRGDIQRALLQANASSSSITNANPQPGQIMTIEWLQDNSGNRTYAWPANCKFAGSAPSASTGANLRDSVTFRFADSGGSNWYELSRAIGVQA